MLDADDKWMLGCIKEYIEELSNAHSYFKGQLWFENDVWNYEYGALLGTGKTPHEACKNFDRKFYGKEPAFDSN